MRLRHSLAGAALSAALGVLIAPALAQTSGGPATTPDRGVDRMQHGMMSRGMMSGHMMGGGCAGMMQSMDGGGARPNSQWQTHPPGNATPN